MIARSFVLSIAVTLAFVMGSCTRPKPASLVLVLVDTLRADHLSSYGYARATSPALDAFARQGVRFENVRAQSACTFPSVNSLLTSRSPTDFLPWEDETMGVPAHLPYLPEILKAQGYRTVAVTASPIFRRSDPQAGYNSKTNFEHGFDVFVEDGLRWADAQAVNAKVREVLAAEKQRPLFLYLHYIDPHTPYRDRADERNFAKPYAGDKAFVREGTVGPLEEMLYRGGPAVALTEEERQHLVDLYDEEIAYFDRRFRELLDLLERNGLGPEALVAVASDHGEAFLENGHVHHCNALYEPLVRVPLILRLPGAAGAGRVRPQAVANLDLVPTLLDYLGADASALALEGRSLRPVIESDAAGDEAVYAWMEDVSVTAGEMKLIERAEAEKRELYDLRADPRETKNLAAARPETVEKLQAKLKSSRLPDPEREDVRERLRALGYVQ